MCVLEGHKDCTAVCHHFLPSYILQKIVDYKLITMGMRKRRMIMGSDGIVQHPGCAGTNYLLKYLPDWVSRVTTP